MVSFMVSSIAELPSYLFTAWAIDHWGRHNTMAACVLLGGAACTSCAFVPAGGAQMGLASVGKFGVAGAFAIASIYTSELFPTLIRSGEGAACGLADVWGGGAGAARWSRRRCIGPGAPISMLQSPPLPSHQPPTHPPARPRAGVLGAANQAARVGGIVAPFIALAGTTHNSSLIPFLTFGIAALVSGALIFTLPETLGVPLPDTMQVRRGT